MVWLINVLFYGVAIIIALMLYFLEQWPTPRRYKRIQKINGPKGVFYLGNAYELKDLPVEDFINWVNSNLNEYARFMRLWFLGVSHVYLKEPEDVQVILSSNQHLSKGVEYEFIMDWLDQGLLTSTGDKWFARRKLLTPAFHFKILEDNFAVFIKNADILTKKITELNGQEVALESLITLCTLDVITETAMGIDVKTQSNSSQTYVKEIKRISELIIYRTLRPYIIKDWIFRLTSIGQEYWKSIKYLHNHSYEVIKGRKSEAKTNLKDETKDSPPKGKVRRALLDTLLELEKQKPGTLSDKDIREEVDTFMFEGHDTTSVALVYIFFNLAKHPDIQDKVAAELIDIFGDSDREVTSNDLVNMRYLEMVIKESLRLYPSVPYISRQIEKDIVFEDGLSVPAPSNIVVPVFYIHRNEKHWPDPLKFDPERFSEEQVQNRHPYAYIPFSAGPRNCIGKRFAMMELKVVVSTVLRKLKIVPITKQEDLKFLVHLVLRTNKTIFCRFVERNQL